MLLSELTINTRYTEVLSGKTVMVVSLNQKGRNVTTQARATHYNSISGRFETIDVVDNQLQPFDVYPPALATVLA
jgi:hypothetical protein